MNDKLKKCPFCGNEAILHEYFGQYAKDTILYDIYCSERCSTDPKIVEYENREQAIQAWNKRYVTENKQSRIKWIRAKDELPENEEAVLLCFIKDDYIRDETYYLEQYLLGDYYFSTHDCESPEHEDISEDLFWTYVKDLPLPKLIKNKE